MKRLLYLILKNDIIRKLKTAHNGEQLIDDITKYLGIPSNLMDKYHKRDANEENLLKQIIYEIEIKFKGEKLKRDDQIKALHFKISQLEDKIKEIIPDLN